MVNEPCAITTRREGRGRKALAPGRSERSARVAPSFLRVGHVDLFARRAAASPGGSAATELEQIVEHALFREHLGANSNRQGERTESAGVLSFIQRHAERPFHEQTRTSCLRYPDIAQRAEPLPERAVAMLEAF